MVIWIRLDDLTGFQYSANTFYACPSLEQPPYSVHPKDQSVYLQMAPRWSAQRIIYFPATFRRAMAASARGLMARCTCTFSRDGSPEAKARSMAGFRSAGFSTNSP